MLPDAAELCSKTRARQSAGYRAPGQGVWDLGRGGTEYLKGYGAPLGRGRFQNRIRNKGGILSVFLSPIPSTLSHLAARRGAVLIWAPEGHPREEGRAVVKVGWYKRMREGCSDFH